MSPTRRRRAVGVTIAALLAGLSWLGTGGLPGAADSYEVEMTDLGTLTGSTSTGAAINNAGVVVG